MTAATATPAVVSFPRAQNQSAAAALGDVPPMLLPSPALSIGDVPGRWFVAHVKSRMEKALAWDMIRLARRNAADGDPLAAHYFLPMDQLARVSARGRYVFHRPVFPGYVFCAGGKDRDDKDGAAGVAADLFATGRICKTIEVKDQARLVRDLDRLDLALRLNPHADPCPGVVQGKPCRVMSGAFAGFEGVVLRKPTGTMLIVLEVYTMNRPVVLEVPAADVEPL